MKDQGQGSFNFNKKMEKGASELNLIKYASGETESEKKQETSDSKLEAKLMQGCFIVHPKNSRN